MRTAEEHEQAVREAREKAGENGKSHEEQLKEKYAFA
jgi:hypothetical protein